MRNARDAQRQRLYTWENATVKPLDLSTPIIEQRSVRSKRPSKRYHLGTDAQGQRIPYFALRIEKRIVSGGITEAQAVALARRVCQDYGIRRIPAIRWGVRGGTWARTGWGWGTIVLPMWARSTHVLLHELAHWVMNAWTHGHLGIPHPLDSSTPSHGPGYLATYLALLSEYGQMDWPTLANSARAAGLRIAALTSEYPQPQR